MITISEIVNLSNDLSKKIIYTQNGYINYYEYQHIGEMLNPIFEKYSTDEINNFYKHRELLDDEKKRYAANFQMLCLCYGVYQCIMFVNGKKDETLFDRGVKNIEKSIELLNEISKMEGKSCYVESCEKRKADLDKIIAFKIKNSHNVKEFIEMLNSIIMEKRPVNDFYNPYFPFE